MKRQPLLFVAVLAAACQTVTPHGKIVEGPVDGNSFVVWNVRVFDGQRSIGRTDVVVRDGRIASVGRVAPAEGLPVIDGTGRTLLPGFIDANTPADSEADALRFGVTTALIEGPDSTRIIDGGNFVIPAIDAGSLGAELAADARIAAFLTPQQRKALRGPARGKDGTSLRIASEDVRRLRSAGVRILAGDVAPNLASHGVAMLADMQLLTRAGLKPAEALEAATRGPAEAFRLTDRGRIASGARADLVLVDGNPLSDIKATRAIVHVFKNGFAVDRNPVPGKEKSNANSH